MEITYLNPNEMPQPHGYSQVLVVKQPSRLIFISGQVAEDKNGNIIGIGDLNAQTHQTYVNISFALEAAGANFSNLVKITTYLRDITQLAIVRNIRNLYIDINNPPASTTVQTVLDHPDLLIEIDAIATL